MGNVEVLAILEMEEGRLSLWGLEDEVREDHGQLKFIQVDYFGEEEWGGSLASQLAVGSQF